jgi:hypothetical protein
MFKLKDLKQRLFGGNHPVPDSFFDRSIPSGITAKRSRPEIDNSAYSYIK